jgi:hypothetical protein
MGGSSLCVLRRVGVRVECDGRAEAGWKVGRGTEGITNLGVPRGTGPGGQRRRGLGAGRRGMASARYRKTWKECIVVSFPLFEVSDRDGCERDWMSVRDLDLQDQRNQNDLSLKE